MQSKCPTKQCSGLANKPVDFGKPFPRAADCDRSDSTAALYHKENVMTDASKTSKLAIASLVMSCLTFPLGPFGFIPGIVCGHAALSEIKSDPMLRGHALAIAGLLIGYMFLSLMVILVVIGRIPLGG
jgi:hypothetical protein